MGLEITWFCLLCVLWTGYFVLEGFDFGVGALLPVVGRNEADRTSMLESIGPVWDGNEVWLVVAGGATFAAFPVWYATMFSGFYLALLLILVLLIVRVVSFEWREKAESPRWKATWAWMNTIASVGAPLLWGIALSSLLHGVPIGSDQNFAGDFGDLFSGYTVLAGIAVCLLFAAHGAVFLTLRTVGELCTRARRAAAVLMPAAAVVGAGFLVWTLVVASDNNDKGVFPGILPVAVAAVSALAAVWLVRAANDRWAFVATTLDDRRRGRDALRQPLPAGHGVESRLREQLDDRERVLRRLHAEGDDRRRGDPPSDNPPLPGVDVPRLPGPHHGNAGGQSRPTCWGGSPRVVPALDRRLLRRARAVRIAPRRGRSARRARRAAAPGPGRADRAGRRARVRWGGTR